MDIKISVPDNVSDCEKFYRALREISFACNLTFIDYSKIGIYKYVFSDGSSIGSLRAHKEAGIIKG